jgi:hypothetical protein
MKGFIIQEGGSTEAFYEDISDPTSIIKMTSMCVQMILGDLVIVSGCFPSSTVPLFIFEDMATLCGL